MRAFGFVGHSGSGKTTLIERLLPRFMRARLRVSVIKEARRDFDIDRPGKDSHRHREAGAFEVMIASDRRWALMRELREACEPRIDQHMARLSPCDLVLVEGFRQSAIPKVEVHRPGLGKPRLHAAPEIAAVACDVRMACEPLPRLDLNDPDEVASFVLRHLGLAARPVTVRHVARQYADQE